MLGEPTAIADAFGRDKNAFRVHPVQDITEPIAFFADQAIGRDAQAIEEQFVRRVAHHRRDRPNRQAIADGLAHVDEEDAETVAGFLHAFCRGRPGEQDHQIRLRRPRYPNFLSPDDVVRSVANRFCQQLGRIGTARRFGDGKCLETQFARGNVGQVTPFLFLAPMAEEPTHRVHLGVARRGVAAGTMNLFQDDARVAQ